MQAAYKIKPIRKLQIWGSTRHGPVGITPIATLKLPMPMVVETGRDFRDPQELQHFDQILPRQTGKTAVYTTVRLHCVGKCQLSLHYHISIQ